MSETSKKIMQDYLAACTEKIDKEILGDRIMEDFDTNNNFIQWKGTDLCMDFYCECGEHNHYDGYFAYYVKCAECGQVYQMDTKVRMKKVNDNDCKPMESIT